MKVAEFRAKLKESLDAAARGEVIKIERGGITFYLATKEHIQTVSQAAINIAARTAADPKLSKLGELKPGVSPPPKTDADIMREREKLDDAPPEPTYSDINTCEHNQAPGECPVTWCPNYRRP
jgi:hypothetical protein